MKSPGKLNLASGLTWSPCSDLHLEGVGKMRFHLCKCVKAELWLTARSKRTHAQLLELGVSIQRRNA